MTFKWTYSAIVFTAVAAIVVSWIGWGAWAAFSHVYAIGMTVMGAGVVLLARSGVRRWPRIERRAEPFMSYPMNQVLAIFDERDDAARAVAELRRAGIAHDHLFVLAGARGSARVDSEGTAHGLIGITERSIEHLLTDLDDLQRYDEAIRAGGVVLAVGPTTDQDRRRIAAIFQLHSGYEVAAFGEYVVEKLDADPSRTGA